MGMNEMSITKISTIKKNRERTVLIIASIIVIALGINFYAKSATYWWDESTYIGMGRFIETGGSIGFWENFRPPVIPLTIALLEMFRTPTEVERLVISSVFAILLLYATLKLAKKNDEETAHWALLLLITAPVIIKLSPRILADIPSTAIITISAVLLFSNKRMPAGIVHGIAILTRFPQIIYIPAFTIYIWWDAITNGTKENMLKAVKQTMQYVTGIGIIVGVYTAFQKIVFGSFTEYIFYAQAVPKIGSAKLFPTITTFYFSYLATTILLLPLLIIGIIYYTKNYKTEKKGIFLTIATALMIGYLTQFPYREERFLVMALPFIAVISAKGLKIVQKILRNAVSAGAEKAFTIIVIVLIVIMTMQGISQAGLSIGQYTPQEKEYYKKISEIKTKEGEIILMAETDALALTKQKIRFLGGIQYARKELERLKPNAAAFAWNNCTYACPAGDLDCDEEKRMFNEDLSKLKITWNATIGSCTLAIYEAK